MLPVPPILMHWWAPFAAFFTKPIWDRVLVLATGAVLVPGRRTVTAVLSVLGRAGRDGFRPLPWRAQPRPLVRAVAVPRPAALAVSFLQRQLLFELETELGLGGVVLWHDRTAIEPGDRWSDKIIEALHKADILLVVLSRNYAEQEWCNRELETFMSRPEAALDPDFNGRIIRVDKQTLEDAEIPAALRPIQAIRFFEYDRLDRADPQRSPSGIPSFLLIDVSDKPIRLLQAASAIP
jgi:hypothetical protein